MLKIHSFILDVPYLFLMKVPYLWLPAVIFYAWPPLVSAVLVGLILLGLLAMNWQNTAWIEKVKYEFARKPESIYIEELRPPAGFVVRNGLLLLALGAGIGWLMNGYLELGWLQWALFAAGFIALYKKAIFFGKRVTYILTDQGIGIRYVPGHLDYRMLIRFGEIRRVTKTSVPEKTPNNWTIFAPTSNVAEGLLLVPKNPKGFSAQVDQILLSSDDLENLAQKFPQALIGSD
ncbi:MAG TPA: hypothetical protein VGK00_09810 [Anaerolineales bacterium]